MRTDSVARAVDDRRVYFYRVGVAAGRRDLRPFARAGRPVGCRAGGRRGRGCGCAVSRWRRSRWAWLSPSSRCCYPCSPSGSGRVTGEPRCKGWSPRPCCSCCLFSSSVGSPRSTITSLSWQLERVCGQRGLHQSIALWCGVACAWRQRGERAPARGRVAGGAAALWSGAGRRGIVALERATPAGARCRAGPR